MLIEWHKYRAKDAVAALIKRLAHRNANVQLYTLEVQSLVWPFGYYGRSLILEIIACKCSIAELRSGYPSRTGV